MKFTNMQKTCPNCSKQFEITDKELTFLEKISPVIKGEKYALPTPQLCPACRKQRRLATRNQMHLYQRQCALTGKDIIAVYSPDKPYKVYSTEAWWSDDWDAMDYGRDYDPERSFFEQFHELQLQVPRVALVIAKNENSPYINHCWNSKNLYMCFNMGFSEDCIYSSMTYHCKNVVDTLFAHDSELCYNIINSQKCYNSAYLLNCSGCTDCYFSFDCKGCSNIAFCSNLRNKKYHLFNKPVSKEEFTRFVQQMKNGSYQAYQDYIKKFNELVFNNSVHLYTHNLNSENCSGDFIINSKNCTNCYLAADSQDVINSTNLDEKVIDSMDLDHAALSELCYEGQCINGSNLLFTMFTYLDSSECMYCDHVMSSKNCFGCVGIKRKEYCILNKQYTKEQYEELVPKIIENMKQRGEYGEFFPPSCTPYAFNETLAQDELPLSEKEALELGYKWHHEEKKAGPAQTVEIPDKVNDFKDESTKQILTCADCGRNYKIIDQELTFYKSQGVPIPRNCFYCRHAKRSNYLTESKLYSRNCAKCSKPIQTTYAPNRPEKIYCEDCYLNKVY